MGMANLPLSLRCIPLLLTLSGCGLVTIRTGGSSTSLGGTTGTATEGTEGASSANGGSGAESPEAQEQREQARAWFGKCSVAYEEFITTWRPLDAEAKKIIVEQRGKPFYESYGKLAGEYRKLRHEARRLYGGHNLPSSYGYSQGTAIELLLAIAAMQVQTGQVSDIPFEPGHAWLFGSFPMSGDDAFDRNVFCSDASHLGVQAAQGGGPGKLPAFSTQNHGFPAPWMTRQEKLDFNARVTALLEKTRLGLNLVIEKKNQWRERAGRNHGGDYGVIKQVKVQPDGSTLVQARALDTPYTCAHTGTYHWNGVAFSDCDIVDLPTRETYAFTVTFKELPSAGLKPGDKLTFSGINPRGLSYEDRENAAWEGLVVRVVTRKGKVVHEADLNDKLDNPNLL